MRRHANFWLLALVLAIVLALASSCGGSSTAEQGSGEPSGNEESADDTQGTDHGNMEMSSGGMDSAGMGASQLVMENGKYSDERFINAMIPHHESAIEMAQVAQENTDNPEIRKLAQGIVDAQQAEIQQMTDWRAEWYPEGEG